MQVCKTGKRCEGRKSNTKGVTHAYIKSQEPQPQNVRSASNYTGFAGQHSELR